MSAEPKDLNLLRGLASRLQNDPAYMGHVLATYKSQEGFDDEDLANHLNCFPEFVVRLALCKRPDADAPDFAEQVRSLSDFTLIDEAILAHIIRQVDSVAELANNPTMAEESATAALGQFSGALAAARDRDEPPLNSADADKPDEEEEV